jgi:hypothetical protein
VRRIALALVLLGCDHDDACIDAPPGPALRAACSPETVIEIPIVLHHPPETPSPGAWPLDTERVSLFVDHADRLLAPFGMRAAVVEDVEENYFPILADSGDACDAYESWAARAPVDGRLHVYVMEAIHEPGLLYEGAHTRGVIAIVPDANDLILAHEIGHVLGLRHGGDPRDVMWPADLADDLEFTAEQGATMRGRACSRFGSGAE